MGDANYKLITEAGELAQAANDLRGEQVIGFDTETTGLDPHTSKLRLIQLATPRAGFIVDCFRLSSDQLKPVLDILSAPRPVKIAHNAKFDAKFLMRHCGARLGAVFDTYLASNLASAGDENDRHSLEAVVNRYLDLPLDKAAQTSDWSRELSEYQLEYAARDAQVLLPLRERLLEKLREMDLLLVADLEFDCVLSIAALELAGIYLDVECWRDLIGRIRIEHDRVADELHRELGPASPQMSLFGGMAERINLDSPAQVKEALARIGIGVEDTREWTLQKLAHQFPVLEKFLEYRGLSKSLSSYGEGILDYINPATGRIHADFRQIGTPTGRITTSSPSLQQIPHTTEYRSCFRAPAGRKFVVSDYSQIEMRILADFARDETLLKAFDSGADLHRMTASQMFGVPLDQVTPRQRESAKGLNYGLVYGMGAEGLAARIESSVKEAEILIERYFAAYSGVERWLIEAAERAVRERRARTASGRLWVFRLDPNDRSQLGALKRVGKNAPIQGCLGPDVRIHTDRGSWKISDLAALDCTEFRVFDGESYAPFRAFPSGFKAAHQITTGDGWSMIASANHRFRVATPNGLVWKRTDQLAQGDLLIAVREPALGGMDETVPYSYVKGHWRETYKSYHLPSKWSPMLAELVGALIGDGSYGLKRGRMHLAVGEADYDVRDWYLHAWKDLFGYQAAVKERPAFGNRHARCLVAVSSVEIRGFLEAQGLAPAIGDNKIIPESLFQASPEIRAGVLRGLFTTDGTVTPECIPAFRTTSPFLARGVRQSLTSLGIASTMRSFKYSEKTAYRVSVNRVDAQRFAEIVGFRAARKQNKLVNPAKPVTGMQDRAPAWMLREVGQAGLGTSLFGLSERAHLRRMASGGGSIQALVKYRDRLTTKWQSPGLERAELYRYVPVVSVIPLDTEIEMYDLEVFADSHSFVADGFITHNSASDIFKRAMTLLDRALLSRDAQIVNSIHDEIVVECEESIAEEVKQIVIQKMIEGAKEFLPRVPVGVEAVISDAWLKK
jgi:DNA polymerase I-like protein with 3'-5' exonuclease and polymerase domains